MIITTLTDEFWKLEGEYEEYVILESEYSSAVALSKRVEAHLQMYPPDDTPQVVETFKARCWCAAKRHYNKQQGFEAYDMYFCKADADAGEDICPFYRFELENKA